MLSQWLKRMRYVVLSLIIYASTAMAWQTEFYTGDTLSLSSINNGTIFRDLKQHINAINMIEPQIYHASSNGFLYGDVDPRLVPMAKKNHTKVIPLVTNAGFSPVVAKDILTHRRARARLLQQLLSLARQQHFAGFQFDFEDMNFQLKDHYTAFIQQACNTLHQHALTCQVAIIPHVPHTIATNLGTIRGWQYWAGVYDVQAIAKAADLVTIMTYDNHASGTTPGPIAGLAWMKYLLKGTLELAPSSKILLGIPDYSGLWAVRTSSSHYSGPMRVTLSYADVLNMQNQLHFPLSYNKQDGCSEAIFQQTLLSPKEYLFAENATAFAAKLALAKRYHLAGIAVWKLGYEDPAIWPLLQKSKHHI